MRTLRGLALMDWLALLVAYAIGAASGGAAVLALVIAKSTEPEK